ncbi:hypothetical protein [Metasolibacillus sp. FSL K6-0083]|uniref:hypothetical protein n=1 Tax=Metasolibacillus sp. FSL K6-0083 TaxID=2921416 RepID=UPI00315A017B
MNIKDSTEEIVMDTDRVSKIVKLKNESISIFEDGRIKPINNPESLTKEERTSILKLMKFSDVEIESFPEELVNELLTDGGVEVEVTQEDFVHIYTDLQGNDYIVTPETMDAVDKIKLRDAQIIASKINLNSGVSTFAMEIEQHGNFTGQGILTYVGKKSNNLEYEYKYRTAWEWSLMPTLTFTDTIATGWQAHTTSVSTASAYKRYANGGVSHDNKVTVDRSNILATKATIDIQNAPGRHYGYIEDTVRIPVVNQGTTGSFTSAYGHSWSPTVAGFGGVTINIGAAGSISFSGEAGDKWNWRNTFIIGNTK